MLTSNERKLRNKLTRVIVKSGLNWVTYSSIVDYSDRMPDGCQTACWIFDPVSKREKILFSANILQSLPVNLLVLVLRHEMLHKAMYRNIRGATNKALINFALDAAINKILFLCNPRGMIKLGNFLFPTEESRTKGLYCVMNPSILMRERNELPNRVQKIFDEIYLTQVEKVTRTENGNYVRTRVNTTCAEAKNPSEFNADIPDPLLLYNKMSSLLNPEDKKKIEEMYEWIKDGYRSDGKEKTNYTGSQESEDGKNQSKEENKPTEKDEDDSHDTNDANTSTPFERMKDDEIDDVLFRGGMNGVRANDKKTIKEEVDGAKIIKGDGFSNYNNPNAIFDKYIFTPASAEDQGLNEFISKWQTEKLIESAIDTIYAEIKTSTTIDIIPKDLTRTGFELIVLDICGPDQIPLYFNEERKGNKKKICCYFDTSPSMHAFIPYMVDIANFFHNCDECEITGGNYHGKYCFSEKVKGIEDWEKFMKGEVRGGYGTSFEIIVRHAINRINEDEVDIIIVFTDGLSSISPPAIEEFNKTNKKCYTIYFADPVNLSYGYGHGRHYQTKDQLRDMSSDLGKLNGGEFTIICNTSNK